MLSQIKTTICPVRGVLPYHLPSARDGRGSLSAVEFESEVPFKPLRYFVTFGVPGAQERGQHAHRHCAQFLVCVHGSCSIKVDDGENQQSFRLDHPTQGIYLPPMIWSTLSGHSADSTLLVFASHHYDAEDYIRDYELFLEEAKGLVVY